MYRAVPAQVDLPALEHEVLRCGSRRTSSSASVAQSAGRPRGSSTRARPTANGMPGTHHVEARVFKDVFPRFRTMQGYHVPRQGRLGLPRPAGRARRREGARLHRQAGHRGVRRRRVQRQVPRVGAAARRRVRGDHRAHGLLGRHGPRLPDDGPGLRRDRLVVAEADLRQGPARPGPPRRALLPALRHRPVRPRAGPGLRDRRRPVGLRALPVADGSGPRGAAPGAALLVWTTTPWTLVSNTAVAVNPDVHLRSCAPPATRPLVVAEPLVPALLGEDWTVARDDPRRRPGAAATYQRPFDLVEHPRTRTTWCSPTTSPPRTAPAWCTRRPRSARTTSRPAAPTACRWSTRSGRDGTSTDDVPAGRRHVLQEGRRDPGRRPRAARAAVPARALRAQLPALLALPHAADLLRAAVLVHPHHRDQGRAARARTRRPTGTPSTIKHGRYGDWLTTTSTGRCPATATGARRCRSGAAREGHLTVRRLARRARPSWPAATVATSTRTGPYVDDVTFALPGVRRPRPAASPRSSTPGSTPARCRSRSGATRTHERGRVRAAVPGRLHLRGHRPDPRLVLHADGRRHAGLRRVVVPERASASATSSPRTAARCPSTSATSSSRSR